MKKITSKKIYDTALTDVYKLMQKGEKKIIDKKANTIQKLADAIRE